MSGSYVESFGQRMKEYSRAPGVPRKRGWWKIRAYHPIHGGMRATSRKEPWLYFNWQQPISHLDRFARVVLGSWREVVFVSIERPDISVVPCRSVDGVDMFLEKLWELYT